MSVVCLHGWLVAWSVGKGAKRKGQQRYQWHMRFYTQKYHQYERINIRSAGLVHMRGLSWEIHGWKVQVLVQMRGNVVVLLA